MLNLVSDAYILLKENITVNNIAAAGAATNNTNKPQVVVLLRLQMNLIKINS